MADGTPLNLGSGGPTVADDDVGGQKYQRIKLVYGADGVVSPDVEKSNPYPVGKSFATRADTFTASGNGTSVDVSGRPCSQFALQVKGGTGAPTAWDVVLEGSLNGTNYTTILRHGNANPNGANADGAVVYAAAAPFLHFRARCVSVTPGPATNIVATIVGMQ